jgi:class 3 adenylate cyclase
MQKIIEEHQGIVNKYLGDGILAYWRDDSDARQDIISAVSSLKVAQTDSGPSSGSCCTPAG